MQLALWDFLRRNIFTQKNLKKIYIYIYIKYKVKDVKEDIHNLAYNERKKKEIRYRIRPKQKFSLSIKIYFNLSK